MKILLALFSKYCSVSFFEIDIHYNCIIIYIYSNLFYYIQIVLISKYLFQTD